MKAAVYIPAYNSEAFISSVVIPEGMDCVVMDNHSSDETVRAARERGFQVVENPDTVSRVENWLRCIDHFKATDYDWLKWLFTGDELCPDLYEKIRVLAEKYPQARMMIFRYEIWRDEMSHSIWSPPEINGECALEPDEAVYRYAKNGNIFGSPVGMCFHRSMETEGLKDALRYVWAADAKIALTLAEQAPVVFSTDVAGRFNMKCRKHYAMLSGSFRALSEEVESRYRALEACRKSGLDDETYEAIERRIEDTTGNVFLFETVRKRCSFSRMMKLNYAYFRAALNRLLHPGKG